MIYLIDDNDVVTGSQIFPATCEGRHIIVADPDVQAKLNETLGHAKVTPDLELPANFYTLALASQEAGNVQLTKENKVAEFNLACEQEIIGNFTSDGLGTPHSYQSDRDDQNNLAGAAQSNKDRFFKCLNLDTDANPSQDWEYKVHTQAQIQAVFEDGCDMKESNLAKCHTLKLQVAAATEPELAEIVW